MADEQSVWFYRSDEQVAAYKKIGLSHPDHVFDLNYDEFLLKTKMSPEELNQTVIHSVTRVLTQSGEEYLVYAMTERRFDGLGNEHSFFRGGLGMYHVPIPEYRLKKDEYGYEEKYVHHVKGKRVAYSIPFNKKNVQKLREASNKTEKEIVEAAEKREKLAANKKVVISHGAEATPITRYSLHKVGTRGSMEINSYDDWLTGDFDTLWRYGEANPTKEKRDRQDSYERTAAAALRMSLDPNANVNANPNDIMDKVRNAVDDAMDKDKHAEGKPYK